MRKTIYIEWKYETFFFVIKKQAREREWIKMKSKWPTRSFYCEKKCSHLSIWISNTNFSNFFDLIIIIQPASKYMIGV